MEQASWRCGVKKSMSIPSSPQTLEGFGGIQCAFLYFCFFVFLNNLVAAGGFWVTLTSVHTRSL